MTLKHLFEPESVAVVGASRSPEKIGHIILKNLLDGGFKGKIMPVNPGVTELLGLPCYPDLSDCGQDIDLVIIALPSRQVRGVVERCASVHAKGVVVTASGFREAGPDGGRMEQEIVDLCRRNGMRLLGPNCLGLINTGIKLNASFAGPLPASGAISIFSQSASLCRVMMDTAEVRHLGLAKVVSVGNKADITAVDILKYLASDPQTKVIIGYLEDIAAGNEFVKAAEEASSNKPVVILKSGITVAGIRAAVSHTGVVASSDSAYGAVFKRAGIIRADSFESLFDIGSALLMQPLPMGESVMIITDAGGAGILAADAAEHMGMRVLDVDGGNPVDLHIDAEPEQYVAALQKAANNPAVDAVMIILTPWGLRDPGGIIRSIGSALDGVKPVVAALMGGSAVPDRQSLASVGLPAYRTPERAVIALKGMLEYANWKKRPPRSVTRFRVNRRRVERIIYRRQRVGVLHLGEVKGKEVLGAYGFHVPEGALASSAEDARDIAERIGFPVAMKIVSPDIVHKSDLGGVFLNVASGEAAEDTYDLMNMKIGKKVPDARIDGVYVEKMIPTGLEIIIGMTRDPQFGPMLMFGLGGIFVEVMKDVTFHLAPITEVEAIQMLKSTKSYGMLEGRRGRGGIDLAAIASGLQRISQLTTDFPQIMELDINPFIVGDFGTEPVVADVRMSLAPLAEKEQE